MSASFLAGVDWQRPWLSHLRRLATPLLAAPDWRTAINAAAAEMGLCNHRGLPVHFVPQSSLPPNTAYEEFISATGCVPTRENLHDFFNALIWLTFPKIKIRLNALQATEIERQCTGGQIHIRRGVVRDAATIFDENAALLVSRNDGLIEALRAHQWHKVFVSQRQEFNENCEIWLFGHALMEKLVVPFKAITAHVWALTVENDYFALSNEQRREWLDAKVALRLESGLRTADFSPLPVLGIPGWAEHQDDVFYADSAVFRPKRKRNI